MNTGRENFSKLLLNWGGRTKKSSHILIFFFSNFCMHRMSNVNITFHARGYLPHIASLFFSISMEDFDVFFFWFFSFNLIAYKHYVHFLSLFHFFGFYQSVINVGILFYFFFNMLLVLACCCGLWLVLQWPVSFSSSTTNRPESRINIKIPPQWFNAWQKMFCLCNKNIPSHDVHDII